MTTETSAREVADYLLASAHEYGSFVSNLKLQKLLYYAQGWHLGIFGSRLFPERFQAWPHGPVIPELYRDFERYSWRNIDEQVSKPEFSPRVIEFLDELIDEYLGMDAYELEKRTHRERPWVEARGAIPIDSSSTAELDEEVMREHFRARVGSGV